MEPVKGPRIPRQAPSTPPQKEHRKILHILYEVFISIIKDVGAMLKLPLTIFKRITKAVSKPELLPISFVEGPSKMTPLRAAHLRFHRLEIDPKGDFVGFGILDGSTLNATVTHFLINDWNPGTSVLLASSPTPELEVKIKYLAGIFDKSFDLLNFQWSGAKKPLLEQGRGAAFKARHLDEGECLLIPGGTKNHLIFYEIKKEKGNWYLKLYNAGAGAEVSKKEPGKFVVPCYEIERADSIAQIVKELYTLPLLTYDEMKKKKGPLSQVVEKIVTSYGGKRLPSEETHREQDRGNCTWKSLSTWFRAQTSSLKITITQQMVDVAANKASFAQKTLAQLVGKQITLNRFFKIIGYENVRSALNEIFFNSVRSLSLAEIDEQRKYEISEKASKKIEKKEKAQQYLSALAKRIHQESAIQRYERKDLARGRRTYIDHVIRKLWAFIFL